MFQLDDTVFKLRKAVETVISSVKNARQTRFLVNQLFNLKNHSTLTPGITTASTIRDT